MAEQDLLKAIWLQMEKDSKLVSQLVDECSDHVERAINLSNEVEIVRQEIEAHKLAMTQVTLH